MPLSDAPVSRTGALECTFSASSAALSDGWEGGTVRSSGKGEG